MCKIITEIKHIEEVQQIIDVCDNDDESDVEADDDMLRMLSQRTTQMLKLYILCVIKSTNESSLSTNF